MPIYTLADFLRNRRKAKDWTQEELAPIAGVGVSTIRDIERGAVTKPDLDTLMKLATALETPVAEFLEQIEGGGSSAPTSAPSLQFPMRRAQDAGISLRAREFAEAYDRLPALAQLAIDAILKAFTHKE